MYSIGIHIREEYSPDEWRNNSRKNEETEPKQKQHRVVDVTGDGSNVRCCKEQYCIGTWNVRPMNQGKLQVVKQEMARMDVNILGISELKWTGMGEFNSDDHYIYIYSCGQVAQRKAKERHEEEETEELKRFMMQEMARRFLYLRRNLVFEV